MVPPSSSTLRKTLGDTRYAMLPFDPLRASLEGDGRAADNLPESVSSKHSSSARVCVTDSDKVVEVASVL